MDGAPQTRRPAFWAEAPTGTAPGNDDGALVRRDRVPKIQNENLACFNYADPFTLKAAP
jgi:hypothetical protein